MRNVNGYVGARFLDQGGFASANQPVASVVDIRLVRLVANLVERDVRRVHQGTPASVEVDAFPGEKFSGRVGRVAPVFDPQTRTAQMEIEVPNPTGRLKPGMYARVQLRVAEKPDAIAVPRNAIVERPGERGLFVVDVRDPAAPQVVSFTPIPEGVHNLRLAGHHVFVMRDFGSTRPDIAAFDVSAAFSTRAR